MSYQCPNDTCKNDEFVALHVVTEPREGAPWRMRKVGVSGHCARCLTPYVISRTKGVYRIVIMRPAANPFADLPSTDRNAAREELRSLLGDLNLPSQSGV